MGEATDLGGRRRHAPARDPRPRRVRPVLAGAGRPARRPLPGDRAGPGGVRILGQAGDRVRPAGHLDDLAAAAPPDGPVVVVGHSLGGVLAALWVSGTLRGSRPWPWRRRRSPWARDPTTADAPSPRIQSGDAPPWESRRWRFPWCRTRSGSRAATRRPWSGTSRARRSALAVERCSTTPRSATPSTDAGVIDGRMPHADRARADDRTVRPQAHDRWIGLLPHADARMLEDGGHQFLLRGGFEPMAAWLAERERRPGGGSAVPRADRRAAR